METRGESPVGHKGFLDTDVGVRCAQKRQDYAMCLVVNTGDLCREWIEGDGPDKIDSQQNR